MLAVKKLNSIVHLGKSYDIFSHTVVGVVFVLNWVLSKRDDDDDDNNV